MVQRGSLNAAAAAASSLPDYGHGIKRCFQNAAATAGSASPRHHTPPSNVAVTAASAFASCAFRSWRPMAAIAAWALLCDSCGIKHRLRMLRQQQPQLSHPAPCAAAGQWRRPVAAAPHCQSGDACWTRCRKSGRYRGSPAAQCCVICEASFHHLTGLVTWISSGQVLWFPCCVGKKIVPKHMFALVRDHASHKTAD